MDRSASLDLFDRERAASTLIYDKFLTARE